MNDIRASADRPTPQTPASAETDSGEFEILRLVQTLFLSSNGHGPRQVVFTGVGSTEGSASVCASAARALAASSSRSVCLVDADLRSPALGGLLGLDSALPRYGPEALREQCVEIKDNLWLAGPAPLTDDSGSLGSASQLKLSFEELRERFEFVLISGPRADVSGDALLLGQVSQGTVLVIDAESTRKISARKVKETFDDAKVRLLGAVLRNRSYPIPRYIYDRL